MQPHSAVHKKPRPRQDPVSCQLCRAKKLKCNRQRPCSNCVSRDVTCIGQYQERSDATKDEQASDNKAILARLEKLENIILASSKTSDGHNAKELQLPYSGVVITSASETTELALREKPRKVDQAWVGSLGVLNSPVLGHLSDGLMWRIGTIAEISNAASYASLQPGCIDIDKNFHRFVWLPPKEDALWLVDEYIHHVSYHSCVIHRPSTRVHMENLYDGLVGGFQPSINHLALLMSMIASSAYLQPYPNTSTNLFLTPQDAVSVSVLWGKNALDILEHIRRSEPCTIHDIQATIIAAQWMYNFEGFSPRARLLNSLTVTLARNLGLHKIDYASSDQQSLRIETEIKRRVWWHIVSTDWLLAINGGHQEGTYLVNPKHMKVCYPCNISDEDMDDNYPIKNLPLSEPTAIAFFIQRIRLAEICRAIADHMPLNVSDPDQFDYKEIIALDGKFEQFILELPIYLRIDEESIMKSQGIYQKHPHAVFQRYLVNLGVHTKRCKLHQPFLIRNSVDPRYGYSRDVCLRSAREVIRIREMLVKESTLIATLHLRLGFITFHVFLAVVVLVMDLCFNNTDSHLEERRLEVKAALQLLDTSEEPSGMAQTLVQSLLDVLRKYQIRLFNVGNNENWVATNSELSSPSKVNRVWESYVAMEPNTNVLDWDKLFSEIDSHGL